jgi:hypothetical protein
LFATRARLSILRDPEVEDGAPVGSALIADLAFLDLSES